MSTYAIYRLADGVVVSNFIGPEKQLSRNIPEGCAALKGAVDPAKHRVDHETLTLVERESQPEDSDVHVVALARETIERIEAGQIRTIREALLGDAAAIERLREQEPLIAAQRGVIRKPPKQ